MSQKEYKILPKSGIEPQYFLPGQEIKPISKVHGKTPIFSYNYLSLDKTLDCFNHITLSNREYITYFDSVKKMSKIPLFDLLDDGGKPYHFHQIEGNNLDLINVKIRRLLNIPSHTPKEEVPFIGQFALYTDPIETTNGKITSKAPRVIFAIGQNGILNILYLDMEHRVYKTDQQATQNRRPKKNVLSKYLGKGQAKKLFK